MNSKHHKNKKSSSKSRSQSKCSVIEEDSISNQVNQDLTPKHAKFAIKTSKVMGRYMVASRDMTPGEIILSELPLVVGPCTGCKVQCLGCYQPLEQTDPYVKCKKCKWPLCSFDCPGLGSKYGHTKEECLLLERSASHRFFNHQNFDANQTRINYYCIVPLRCFLLKNSDPKKYEQLLKMEHHDAIRRNIPEVWHSNQLIVDRIVKDYGLKDLCSEDDVHTICGILEVNAFEIGQQGVNIRGLYPSAFLMSHNCVPNTSHCDEEVDYRLTVRASTPIKINQPITLSYAYTLQSTLKRREHLLTNKFFECSCDRCSDKTELGTFLGALRCPKCNEGLVLADQPLNAETTWSCQSTKKCPGYKITAKAMELLLNRISEEIDKLDSNDIEGFENVLAKYRNVLHPTHFLNIEVKLNLSQLYGKIHGYLIHDMSDRLLERKVDICQEILKVFDVLEPGHTRLRGVTLYELHAPVLILTTRQFERKSLSRNQLRARIRQVVRYLEEASAILANEPARSSEGLMGVAARDALKKMQDWIVKM